MTEFDRRRDIALTLLRKTSIGERNYLPPTFPILWRLGVKVPPPHFLGFFSLLLIMGLPFGLCGLGIYMTEHGSNSFSVDVATAVFCVVTVFFGGGISFYYRSSARLHRLPDWKNL